MIWLQYTLWFSMNICPASSYYKTNNHRQATDHRHPTSTQWLSLHRVTHHRPTTHRLFLHQLTNYWPSTTDTPAHLVLQVSKAPVKDNLFSPTRLLLLVFVSWLGFNLMHNWKHCLCVVNIVSLLHFFSNNIR